MFSPRSRLFGALLTVAPSLILATICDGFEAPASDIAACANQLTARGSETCNVRGSGGQTTVCTSGAAEIVLIGIGSSTATLFVPCVNIAISVGQIMDSCGWTTEGVAQSGGETAADGNANIIVHANHV